MKVKRWPIWLAAAIGLVVGVLWGIYRYADPEKLELDSSVRASAPGQFVPLSDGYTHYELGGPADAPVVVLAAGFSVPYYIWDPTFKVLTDAGFRVLRYDYYGRGFSDRPDIPFTDAMYIRQLDELLTAIRITVPLHLVGISFGGSFITSFADRYPDRVRSLVYFDPSLRMPYNLTLQESLPPAWNYLTAVLDEHYWAQSQLGDFLEPMKFPDWPERYREQTRYRGFRRARLSEFVANKDVDQTDQAKRVGEHPRPVLIIWGKQDNTVPFEESEWWMILMPNARLVPIESSGHLPQWEQPDAVHSELIKFLSTALASRRSGRAIIRDQGRNRLLSVTALASTRNVRAKPIRPAGLSGRTGSGWRSLRSSPAEPATTCGRCRWNSPPQVSKPESPRPSSSESGTLQV